MKKLIAMMLAVMMVVGMTACASSNKAKTANDGVLTMATNAQFPPYEYYEGDTITGIDVDIANAIAEKLGLTLNVEDMEFDSVIESVKGGKADIGMAGITVTAEREEAVDFTSSYATATQVIVVAEDNDTIAGTNDDLALVDADGNVLEGTVIAVQRNTTGDLYATWNMEDLGLATVDRYSKHADAIQAVLTGKADCVILDNEPAKVFVSETEGLKMLEAEYVEEQYAIAMSKDNKELYDAVNGALEELIKDGTVQTIVDKYISAE